MNMFIQAKEKMEIEEKNIQRQKEHMTQLQIEKLRELDVTISQFRVN